MKEFFYTITDPIGIHARPAGLLVKEASQFKSEIKLIKDDKIADAKRIFSVMGLGIKQNEKIKISINGPDEEKASTELEEFFKQNL